MLLSAPSPSSQHKACQRGLSANLSPPSLHRSLPFRLLRFPLKLPFLPAPGLLFFSLFLFFSSHSYTFSAPWILRNSTDFGVPLGRPRERFRSRRQYGPCKARGHQPTEQLNWFFFVWRRFGVFCFQYCSAGRQSQSVSRYNHTSPATKISSKVLSKFFVLQTTYFSTLFKKESYTVSYLYPSFSVLTGLDEVAEKWSCCGRFWRTKNLSSHFEIRSHPARLSRRVAFHLHSR